MNVFLCFIALVIGFFVCDTLPDRLQGSFIQAALSVAVITVCAGAMGYFMFYRSD